MVSKIAPVGETKITRTADGRELAYLEFGEQGAPLLIHNHGGPSSRLEGTVLAEAAVAAGLRLVSVDRPGIGRSTAQPGRSFRDWAEDLVALADALGQECFGVSGWSEGGPWAMAAAAYIDPARLLHVAYLAGAAYGAFGDNSAAPYLDKVDALGGRLALHHRLAFHLMYEVIALGAAHFRKSYNAALVKSVNERDRAVLEEPGIADAFADTAVECFRQGSEPLVEDAELLYRKWAFDVTAIERPVHMWQGTEDHLVPFAINEQVAQRMPGAVWHPVEGEDHFFVIPEGKRIFELAAQELGSRG